MEQMCLNRLGTDWEYIQSGSKYSDGIIVYGLGIVGKRNLKKLKNDFRIPFIIDNSQKQNTYKKIPVKTLEEAGNEIQKYKIVIMGTSSSYRSMASTLEAKGLVVYKDFCSIEQFLAEWYWKYRNEVCLLQIDVAVTLKCTLQCRDCNMFIPYHQGEVFELQNMKNNFELLFRHVDYLSSCILLGGEPLLNKDIGKLIEYLNDIYQDKIGKIGIITNGTIIPDKKLLDIIKKHNVEINISDYTKMVPYGKRLTEVIQCFETNGIPIQLKRDLEWCAFGFPMNPNINKQKEKHMHLCAPLWHGLSDKKYYYCNVAWSAGRLNLFKEKETDYIDLEKLQDKGKLLYHALGAITGGLSFCEFCGGVGNDNCQYVEAGLQIEKEELAEYVSKLQNRKSSV